MTTPLQQDQPVARVLPPLADPATARHGAVLFRRFLQLWIPLLVVLAGIETGTVFVTGRAELWTLVVLTIAAGVAMLLAALSLSRQPSYSLIIATAALADAAGIATGFLSSSGNDAAIMAPFLGALMLVTAFDGRRLVAAFTIQWTAGMIGAAGAYAVSDLHLVPHPDPIVVSLAACAAMTFIAYCLLWWVRDLLSAALASARTSEAEVLRNAQALEALVGSSPVPTIGFDRDGVVRTWNPAAEAAFGWTAAEAIGRHGHHLDAVDNPTEGAVSWLGHALAGGVIAGERARWGRRHGGVALVQIHAARLQDADGRALGVVAQVLDETERDALRARVAEAERMEAIGQLAGGIAHDFNNLLTAVSGYAELIEGRHGADDQERDDAAEISRAADRGADLVRQLLAFGRRQAVAPSEIDLNGLLDGLVPVLRRLTGSKVRLELERGPALRLVLADPSLLEQVFVNLVVNARDAMPDGGTVSIWTSNVTTPSYGHEAGGIHGPAVRVCVEDTGLGMDESTLARAFEPFFSTRAPGHGAGLGLATVYGIVRQSGGTVTASSAPGRGTTFELLLPAVATSGMPELPGAPMAGRASPPGTERVLVVDDEEQVRRLAERVLDRLGYQVAAAEGRDSALAAAADAAERGEPFDLILSDVVMPEVRGPELVRQVRTLHPAARVLYMTGFAGAERPAAAGSGVAGNGTSRPTAPDLDGPVIAKPFALAELGTRVRAVLDGAED